jgi:hypothetical protein
MEAQTCCEVVTNNNNKTYSCDCWCIVLNDSFSSINEHSILKKSDNTQYSITLHIIRK